MIHWSQLYVGECCREWVLVHGYTGRCGLCDQVPKAKRPMTREEWEATRDTSPA